MNRYTACLLLALSLTVFSCKKSEDGPTGGKGGNATLRITPRHHNRPIDSCTVYIKYNTVNPPSDGRYDDSAQCIQAGGIPVATITGLKDGNYYLYGYGWDPLIIPADHVKGGTSLVLSTQDTTVMNLAVSEGD